MLLNTLLNKRRMNLVKQYYNYKYYLSSCGYIINLEDENKPRIVIHNNSRNFVDFKGKKIVAEVFKAQCKEIEPFYFDETSIKYTYFKVYHYKMGLLLVTPSKEEVEKLIGGKIPTKGYNINSDKIIGVYRIRKISL
jgi:hypothetical protein